MTSELGGDPVLIVKEYRRCYSLEAGWTQVFALFSSLPIALVRRRTTMKNMWNWFSSLFIYLTHFSSSHQKLPLKKCSTLVIFLYKAATMTFQDDSVNRTEIRILVEYYILDELFREEYKLKCLNTIVWQNKNTLDNANSQCKICME